MKPTRQAIEAAARAMYDASIKRIWSTQDREISVPRRAMVAAAQGEK